MRYNVRLAGRALLVLDDQLARTPETAISFIEYISQLM
jgi:hypothetical protein